MSYRGNGWLASLESVATELESPSGGLTMPQSTGRHHHHHQSSSRNGIPSTTATGMCHLPSSSSSPAQSSDDGMSICNTPASPNDTTMGRSSSLSHQRSVSTHPDTTRVCLLSSPASGLTLIEMEASRSPLPVAETAPSSPQPSRSVLTIAERSAPRDDLSEDEVVGVTAEGELLFRRRDGHSARLRRRAPAVSSSSSAVSPPFAGPTPIRPTPQRPAVASAIQHVDGTTTNRLVSPSMTTPLPPPPSAAATHHQSPSMPNSLRATSAIRVSHEEIHYTQLALRMRDRENDIYCDHVREEIHHLNVVRCARQRMELHARLEVVAWDLRRL